MDLERHWYQSSTTLLSFALLPFSWLFRLIVAFRRFLYRHGWKTVTNFSVPVIVVGNLSVGGTGKTPMVIWLANFLRERGYEPGIVSRGVGGKANRQPFWVHTDSDPAVVGDEALLIVRRARCPMVIARKRVAAVRELLTHTSCNVVISDDGLQHYRMGRALEIVMIDGERGFGNGHMLPAGPLREPVSRLKSTDFVVVQGETSLSIKHSHLYKMQLAGHIFVAVNNPDNIQEFSGQKVHAVAGIGNPQRFFATLRALNIQATEHIFPDHHLYQKKDFAFTDKLPILMTEKDAVKCGAFADRRFWCLPVQAEISDDFGRELMRSLKCVKQSVQ